MILKIRTYGDPVLKQKSEPVEEVTPEIKELLNDMLETMRDAEGVGIAAPQVGVSKRIFLLEVGDGLVRYVINPEFIEYSQEISDAEEGCLSVPGVHKKVVRPAKVKVKYLNEEGKEIIEEADGLLARAFMHENDHLEGELFVEKISPIAKRMVSKKLQKLKKDTLKGL